MDGFVMSGLSEMSLTQAICLVRNRWDSQLSRSVDILGQQLFRLAGAVYSRLYDDRQRTSDAVRKSRITTPK